MSARRFVLPTALFLVAAMLAGETAPAQQYPLNGFRPTQVEAHLNVEYLPSWRYSGDRRERGDQELVLDLWVPKGMKRCPMVVLVHGGSYHGGSKDLGKYAPVARSLLDRGIAVASLNYIRMPKGIRPQVWYDYRDAMRYLRKRADELGLDPLAFGAFGWSAGGWLISTAAHGTGDYLCTISNGTFTTIAELAKKGWSITKRPDREHSVWCSLQAERPAYADVYGSVQAIAYDFSHLSASATSGSPALLQITGDRGTPATIPVESESLVPGHVPARVHELARAGHLDMALANMTADAYRGKSVHCPHPAGPASMTRRIVPSARSTGDEAVEGQLCEVMADWFLHHLAGEAKRAPTPEIHPGLRVIDGPTEVRLVVPVGPMRVHYTVDGRTPTTDSPVYTGPFMVEGGSLVQAMTIMADRRPSTVAVAHFTPGPVPPRLIRTERVLPSASVGEPYSFTFTADQDGALYWLRGDLVPYRDGKGKWEKRSIVTPNGMRLDPESGIWSGTPTSPGRFWIQIAVQERAGGIARLHDFTWEVAGAGDRLDQVVATRADTDRELLRCSQLDGMTERRLIEHAAARDIALVVQRQVDEVLVITPEEQYQAAKAAVLEFFGSLPDTMLWCE